MRPMATPKKTAPAAPSAAPVDHHAATLTLLKEKEALQEELRQARAELAQLKKTPAPTLTKAPETKKATPPPSDTPSFWAWLNTPVDL